MYKRTSEYIFKSLMPVISSHHMLLGVPIGDAKLARAFLSFKSITIPTFYISKQK